MKIRILFVFHMPEYELHILVYMDDIWVYHLIFQYMLDGRNHLVYRTQNSSIWMSVDTFGGSIRYLFEVTSNDPIWPYMTVPEAVSKVQER